MANRFNRKRLLVGVVSALIAAISVCAGGGTGGQQAASTPTPTPTPIPAPSAASTPRHTINVVVIGDSIAFGGGDCGGCAAYVDLYASALSKRPGLQARAGNYSTHDGLHAVGLIQRLKTETEYRRAVQRADILIISILHNDTTWASDTDTCDGNKSDPIDFSKYTKPCVAATAKTGGDALTQILAQTKSLRAGKPTVRIVPTIYNDWIGTDGAPAGSTKGSKLVLDTFEREMCRVAKAAGAVCLDVYRDFNGPDGLKPSGDLLAFDFTHPSAKGHERIAQLLEKVDVSKVAGH